MPSTGQPVIIKNKIVYGYMDKATVCRDMGRADYNDLTEAQQLNGDVYFIQGVDASAFAPTNSLWNKVGTTPLDSDLPADCSQAINEIKSNLTVLPYYQDGEEYKITSSIYITGFTGSTGKNITGTIYLPKIIPSGYTLTFTGSINNIRVGSTVITSGITISSVDIRGDNAIIITCNYTTSATSNSVGNVVPNSLTLTFHAPT